MIILRRSFKGVPHTIVEYRGQKFSVCYFKRDELYRVWPVDNRYRSTDPVGEIPLKQGEEADLYSWLDKNYTGFASDKN